MKRNATLRKQQAVPPGGMRAPRIGGRWGQKVGWDSIEPERFVCHGDTIFVILKGPIWKHYKEIIRRFDTN